MIFRNHQNCQSTKNCSVFIFLFIYLVLTTYTNTNLQFIYFFVAKLVEFVVIDGDVALPGQLLYKYKGVIFEDVSQ